MDYTVVFASFHEMCMCSLSQHNSIHLVGINELKSLYSGIDQIVRTM